MGLWAVAAVAAWILQVGVVPLVPRILALETLPQWDMAKYGAAGLRLSERLTSWDVLGFLAEVHAMDTWPPGFPLLEVPFFWLLGPDFSTPRLLVWGLFGAAVLAMGWVALGLDRRLGPAMALVAMALVVVSPLHRVFASLVMLEIPGTLFLLLAMGSYLRARMRPWEPFWWHATGAMSCTLFFIKYNYGLLWILPLVALEAFRQHGGPVAALEAFIRGLTALDWRRPWNRFVALWLLGLVLIRLSGGIDGEWWGLRIRATSIGNPAFALYVLILLRAAWRPHRTVRWLEARWRRWAPATRVLAVWMLPIVLWLTVPPHLKEFFGFVENRSSGPPRWSVDSLLYYPKSIATDYAPEVWIGGLVLVLASGALVWGAGRLLSGEARPAGGLDVVVVVLFVSAVALLAHPYKLPRFAFTTLAPLWLAAVWGGVILLDSSLRSIVPRRPREWLVFMVAGLAAIALVQGLPDIDSRWQQELTLRSVPGDVLPVVEQVVRTATLGEGPTVVLGTWNLLSPALIEWVARQQAIPEDQHPMAARVLGPRKGRRWLGRAERIIQLEYRPTDPALEAAFLQDTAGEAWAREWIEAEDFQVVTQGESSPSGGYEWMVFARSTIRESESQP